MKKQRLKWDDELDTGTVKKSKTYTSEEVAVLIDGAYKLLEENKKLTKVLEEIKKKCIGATTIRPITDLMNIRSIAEGVLSD